LDAVARRLNQAFGPEFAPADAFDLAPLREALKRLGDPHKELPPTFHLAGTNGKGATGAFLAAICEAAGLRVHVFMKPHLLHTRERVRLCNRPVSDETFLAAIERVAALHAPLRHFEAQVAAAFLLFAETPADALVLEAGMGGAADATNVIDRPAAAILTPIDLDHIAALGADRAAIAAHKAGVIKPGAPAVIARQTPEAMAVIEARAAECAAPLFRCGVQWDAHCERGRMIFQAQDRLLDLPLPALFGAHQLENAGAAIMALCAWGDPRINQDAVARGVQQAWLPARLQRLTAGPLVSGARETWLDGAHNPHGARALAAALNALQARAPREVVLIVGVLARKDAQGILGALCEAASRLIAVPVPDNECVEPQALARIAASLGFDARASQSLERALASVEEMNGSPRIVICGSLALAGEALRLSHAEAP
jgi:dihydrofolate synthase/folylpolyglutamate synthase